MLKPVSAAMSAALVVLGAPALATGDAKATNCAATAGIVSEAIAQRRADAPMQGVIDFLRSDAAGVDDRYDQTIPVLVGWVYTLEPAQLTPDAAAAFEQQCLDYDG